MKSVVWFAVYQVGQRVTDRFDDIHVDQLTRRLPRVFIVGDACHTHSAKAGQGMNVSMQDAFNLGWKLACVLDGRTGPELLCTYSAERQAIAQGLVDYEKTYCPDLHKGADIFDLRGVDREQGATIVVCPDQYVSTVLPLDAHDELAAFFSQFLLSRE